jgi:hypothetical protein
MPPTRTLLLAAAVPLLLAGCAGGTVSRAFGIAPQAPTEFEVTTQAPLSMPPDYLLRPPQPGAPRPQALSQSRQAEAVLVPQTALAGSAAGGSVSPGQEALLQAAGPPVSAAIRNEVDAAAARRAEDHSFVDQLMFWRKPAPPGTLLDPQREAKRLRENAALGESPLAGDTPIIQRPQKTLWDMIF